MMMPGRRDTIKRPDSGDAVSEIIGAVLLISLVVLAVAIVAVLLFSQSAPQKVPNVNFMTGTLTDNGVTTINLFHNGGDSLAPGTFSVMVDNQMRTCTVVDGGDWSLGKNCVLSVSGVGAHSIALVYNGTGTAMVLRSGTSSNITSPARINPDIRTGAQYPPVVQMIPLMQNVTNNSIYYFREGGTKINGGYIQFNVTKGNSTLFYKTSGASTTVLQLPLDVGDTVKITPGNAGSSFSDSFSAISVGDQIWELTADKATVAITNHSGNPGLTDVMIVNTWVNGYKNPVSTLVLAANATPGSGYTELVVNKYPSYEMSQTFTGRLINGTSTSVPTISAAGPTSAGYFVLRYDNRTYSTKFIGSGTIS